MLRKMKEISLENVNDDDDHEDDKNEKLTIPLTNMYWKIIILRVTVTCFNKEMQQKQLLRGGQENSCY